MHRDDDLVPLIPDTLCTCSIMNSFCQVGMQMKLKASNRYTIKYRGLKKDVFWSNCREKWRHLKLILPCVHKIKSRHFYKSYLNDIMARKNALEVVTLDEYYEVEMCGRDTSQQ